MNEPTSPPCGAADADDVYMGYAGRDEIVAALNELLEAKRAGARVAAESAKTRSPAGFAELMRHVRADEAHWCAMLDRHIRCLDGSPSHSTGDFHARAMAIADPVERLSFLNRGQQWVVRKLEALMPRIRDDRLHADLAEMAQRHRDNVAAAEDFLGRLQSRK